MNYHHQFHAGNFADVFKHCTLLMLFDFLAQKDKSILFLDTHSGLGTYDLNSSISQKTHEYMNGIAKIYNVKNAPCSIRRYLNIVQKINNQNNDQNINTQNVNLAIYPGSPKLINSVMRAQDQMILVDLNPKITASLKKEFRNDKRVAVHNNDGYLAPKAFLPPKSGRGLVLIDPSFEQVDEFEKIYAAMKIANQRFPNGVYAIWYPIKEAEKVADFYLKISSIGFKEIITAEISIATKSEKLGLTACGMLIINPPWKFADTFKPEVSWLQKILTGKNHGSLRILSYNRRT